jgi:transposase
VTGQISHRGDGQMNNYKQRQVQKLIPPGDFRHKPGIQREGNYVNRKMNDWSFYMAIAMVEAMTFLTIIK